MPVGTNFVSPDWYATKEGRTIMSGIMNRNTERRKAFGVLERPQFSANQTPDEFEYKIFVSGKSGVGKTSTVAKLSANDIPATHSETPGIQTSTVYWPAKVVDIDRVIMFKLQFWDAGENALKKFDHILPACKERADGILFTFSFADKSSFEDLPQQMSRIIEPHDSVCKFAIGTKLDQQSQCEVTQQNILDYESNWKLPVLSIKNTVDTTQANPKSDIAELAPILNYMCDELWRRDKIIAGNLGKNTTDAARVGYC